jgi:hypothetical protein
VQLPRGRLSGVLGCCLLLTFCAGCTSRSATLPLPASTPSSPTNAPTLAARSTGTVSGRVFGFGGPYPGRTFPPTGPGTVVLTADSSGGRRYPTTYDADGAFTIDLPPGSYRIRGSTFDGLTCIGTVRVVAARSVRASAVCALP